MTGSYFRLALMALILGSEAVGSTSESVPARPNFLLIFTDDQGTNDVGCYGSEIPTPHIDSLAQDGLKFDAWYVASSICTPSRFGLLTGRNPSRSKDALLGALMFLDPLDATRGLHPDETTIATTLSQAGYQTALIGKWHLGHGQPSLLPQQHGFKHSYGHTAGCIDFYTMSYGNTPDWYRNGTLIQQSGYATDLITEEAVAFLNEQEKDKPFFLHLAYNAPHFGKGWNDGENKPVNLLQPHPRDLEKFQHIKDPTRRKFAAKVAALDDGIGKVLATLEANGLAESTLVIFMTDHGGDSNYGGSNLPYRDGKATLFEGGIRVPCLMRWTGKIKPSTSCSDVTSALDIFPTLTKLAGVDRPDGLDGQDISEVILAKQVVAKRELFWELGRHAELQRGQWLALRVGGWKYVQTPQDGEWLFNLDQDPYERHNLRTERPEHFHQLKTRARVLSQKFRSQN